MQSQQLYPIILINLSILLLASWGFGFVILKRLVNENKKLKAKDTPAPNSNKPVTSAIDERLESVNELKIQAEEKQAHLTSLESIHADQKDALEMWRQETDEDSDAYKNLLNQHQKSEALIKQLQNDIQLSLSTIETLEYQLQENDHQSDRISILEASEKRLKKQVNGQSKQDEQMNQLAAALKKTRNINLSLSSDNIKLKESIKKLSKASEKQRDLINKISNELEKASQLEEYQNQTIAALKEKLDNEKSIDGESDKSNELEKELKDMQEKLERTLREKGFIESYLIEMDKTLANEEETEKAMDESRKKINEIEDSYPEFEIDHSINQHSSNNALSKLEVGEDNYPELMDIVKHNRLLGLVNEFWNTLDTPPIHLLSEDNVTRPTELNQWVNTPLQKDDLNVVIGIDLSLAEILRDCMNAKDIENKIDTDEALVTMSQKISASLSDEILGDYGLGESEILDGETSKTLFHDAQVAAEALQESKNQPLYVALLKTTQ